MPLQNEGFQSVRDMVKLNEEDLEDIGIVKLGHQKKILLAIKRVKDILSGKVVVPCVNFCCQSQMQPAIAIGPVYTQSQVSCFSCTYVKLIRRRLRKTYT